MPDSNDRVLELLIEMNERIERLEVAFERLAPAPKISRVDRALLIALLPALHATFETTSFRAADVLADQSLNAICARKTTKGLGKFIARTSGVWIDGRCLEARGEEHNVWLWGVRRYGLSGLTNGCKAA